MQSVRRGGSSPIDAPQAPGIWNQAADQVGRADTPIGREGGLRNQVARL
jgi:hypothetical protein